MTRQQILPLDIIERLERSQELPSNVDLNAPDGDGFTVLMLAAYNNQVRAVECLLALGADPDAESKDFDTPLTIALAESAGGYIVELIAPRANVNKECKNGDTPASLARWIGNAGDITLLSNLGAVDDGRQCQSELLTLGTVG